MMKRFFLAVCAFVLMLAPVRADEGMYPLSELQKLKLKSKGIRLQAKDLYNPNGVSLIDAIVQLGGCTGSFVSKDGLVLTNHHCAFGAVQAVSRPENDYVTKGLFAGSREEEIPAKGLTVRITESYKDVSTEVLSAVSDTMEYSLRTKTIEKKIRQLVREMEKGNPGKRIEVSEMFTGRTYVLFIYATFRDVRLVYVPPRSIGEFGGDDDNWVWPRHTGDFSFVRVYVGPDGKAADYSKENVPYHPKKYLKINSNGVEGNDPVCILGYPGRTFRHRTSHFLNYENAFRMPFIVEWYEWQIATMEEMGRTDRATALKFDARIKGLSNTSKNFRGKLQGIKRLDLVSQKREEERQLQAFIEAAPIRRQKYGTALTEIGRVYEEMTSSVDQELLLEQMRTACAPLNIAGNIIAVALDLEKPDSLRSTGNQDKLRPQTYTTMTTLPNYHAPYERAALARLLTLASGKKIPMLDSLFHGDYSRAAVSRFVDDAFDRSPFANPMELVLGDSLVRVLAADQNDPFMSMARGLRAAWADVSNIRQAREGALNKFSALYLEVKEQYQKKAFIPDANSTLRFTFGSIKGYSPKDATYYSPITTLAGVLQKTTGVPPYYDTPPAVVEAARKKEFGRFKSRRLNNVPVDILYDTDTTGGNSGSPVLNADGELVGVNFDRAWEATINDYAWSASYSRSIAVDIRYVLWIVTTLGGGGDLLTELGVR